MIIETAEYNAKLVGLFIRWYWVEMPYRMIRKIYQYVLVLSRIYSFVFLLKTLFAPWKNQLYAYPSKGFDLKRIFEVWTSNSVSRLVGAFVRIFTIFLGLIITALVILIGCILSFIWVTYPVLFFVLIVNSFL